MERTVEIYIGNAAKYDPGKFYVLEGYTVTDSGDVYCSGEKLKQFTRYGYKYVRLPIDGNDKPCKVHRIVATTFRDICGEFNEVVNHLDENKENNSASNLRWTSNADNLSWGTIEERRKKTIEINGEIRNIVRKLYSKNNIAYHGGIKIKRLKTCYKITDKKNNITLYTLGKEIVFNEKRGSKELFEIKNATVYFTDIEDTQFNNVPIDNTPIISDTKESTVIVNEDITILRSIVSMYNQLGIY